MPDNPTRPIVVTYRAYFVALLTAMHIKARRANLRTLAAVSLFENTGARFNPLAVTQNAPGATPYNTFGADMHVYNYPDLGTGVVAAAELFAGSHWDVVRKSMRNRPARFGMLRAWSRAYTWVPGLDLGRVEPDAKALDRQLHRALPNQ